jgi:hypothetical protein
MIFFSFGETLPYDDVAGEKRLGLPSPVLHTDISSLLTA